MPALGGRTVGTAGHDDLRAIGALRRGRQGVSRLQNAGREVYWAAGASLDPLNVQTPYSAALLGLFEELLADPAYVERLKRHYTMFKAAIVGPSDICAEKKPKRRQN